MLYLCPECNCWHSETGAHNAPVSERLALLVREAERLADEAEGYKGDAWGPLFAEAAFARLRDAEALAAASGIARPKARWE